MFRRTASALYGLVCYALGMAALGYTALWLIDLTPRALDAAATPDSWGLAVAVNALLVAVFALQHSGMARPSFKRWLTRFLPAHLERSTYVLMSAAAMALFFVAWQPLGVDLWRLESGPLYVVVLAGYGLGWGVLVYATFCINHFDLMGLRQVWLHLRQQPQSQLPFVVRGLYRLVRHPIYVGWLMVFWLAPVMTVSHLLFAILTTLYTLRAIRWEEQDLLAALPEYASYRSQVPTIVPSARPVQATLATPAP